MAVITYALEANGGRQVAETMDGGIKFVENVQHLSKWMLAIGAAALQTNTDFMFSDGSAASDTMAQLATSTAAWLVAPAYAGGPTNQDLISRFYRGA